MGLRFGPAGIGPTKDAIKNLEKYSEIGLNACEISFTYSVYIKNKSDIENIKTKAKELDISLSIHAPYFVNLSSEEKDKREASIARVVECLKVGEMLGCKNVVVHPGYYKGNSKEETYKRTKESIIEIMSIIHENNWKIKIAPETMGKVNVFGSIDEIYRLVSETGCSFCIDFAHILAREKKIDFEKLKRLFGKHNNWHCHFSGIEYGEKGEKKHIPTPIHQWKEVLENLPKSNDIVIINESPDMINDSQQGLKLYQEMK